MSTINTILIKRRLPDSPLNTLPSLSGGEIGYNEKTSTLFYGASGLGSIPIAGAGAFVDRTTSQTIEGDKTFSGLTTLSSVTVSSNSTLDLGGNILTNIGTPVNDTDASTKLYVDDLAGSIAQNFVDITNNQTISGEKSFEDNTFVNANLDVEGYVQANSYTINGTEVIDSSRNATFVDITASGNVIVTGDLTVEGNTTTINTSVTTTSAFDIINSGTGPALEVTQTGEQAVAAFYDDSNIALFIDGKTGTPGYVGVGTSTPNQKLTVSGNISASGNIYSTGGMVIDGGGTNTTLYVENGKIGINTETPNEALTIVGNISSSEDIFVVNGNFTGTVNVDSAVTLASTLYVTDVATFNSNVSAAGAVQFDSTVTTDGIVTINNDLIVAGTLSLDNGLITSDGSGTITGTAGVSRIVDFVIDGGLL